MTKCIKHCKYCRYEIYGNVAEPKTSMVKIRRRYISHVHIYNVQRDMIMWQRWRYSQNKTEYFPNQSHEYERENSIFMMTHCVPASFFRVYLLKSFYMYPFVQWVFILIFIERAHSHSQIQHRGTSHTQWGCESQCGTKSSVTCRQS